MPDLQTLLVCEDLSTEARQLMNEGQTPPPKTNITLVISLQNPNKAKGTNGENGDWKQI
jgi:hypothetical protein